MNRIFDEYGNLNIEDLIVNQPSFTKIMEDGIVTEEEIREQSKRVEKLLRSFEQNASDSQIEQMKELLAQMSVLLAARELLNRQNPSSK